MQNIDNPFEKFKLLSLPEAAKILNISVSTLRRRCKEGLILYVQAKRGIKIVAYELLLYIQRNCHGVTA
jgi:predicted site-specific integrase-resolvase